MSDAIQQAIEDAGMAWWWCSFATEHEFLGAVCVFGTGDGPMLATLASLNLNPGGEVQMVSMPFAPPTKWRGRLLTREDVAQMDREGPPDQGRQT